MQIILATLSPYRKEVFESLNIPFKVKASKVDESQLERGDPGKLVRELAKLKAEAVAKNYKDAIVIGFDSVGFFNGKILEKPKSEKEAFKRLKLLSGKKHYHYTGIHIINTAKGKRISRVDKVSVFMRAFSDKEIKRYLKTDPAFNTFALGYNVQKCISASFIRKIEGNHLNLLGIPLSVLMQMLNKIGYKLK